MFHLGLPVVDRLNFAPLPHKLYNLIYLNKLTYYTSLLKPQKTSAYLCAYPRVPLRLTLLPL
jgi:hypothetical protein